jgi:hypothetical protein
MLPGLTLPAWLLEILSVLRPCFTAPGFVAFCGLVAGLAGRVRRRTVVGMLLGGCLQHAWPHDRAHYFFARARWELDQLGLAVAHLAALLVPPGADLRVAVDDSVFRRSVRKAHGAGWRHDGSSPSRNKLGYGNCFVVVAILVRLPFCTREIGLPVLARLHLPGKGAGPGKVETAAALVSQLALAFPARLVHVGGRCRLSRPGACRPAGQRDLDLLSAQRGAVCPGAAAYRQAGPASHQGRAARHRR